MTEEDGDLALMVKPQFEVGKDRVGKGGVVRDPALRAEAVATVAARAAELGWGAQGGGPQPAAGPVGQRRVLPLAAARPGAGRPRTTSTTRCGADAPRGCRSERLES